MKYCAILPFLLIVLTTSQAQVSAADSLRNEGKLDRAINEYRHVITQNPANVGAAYRLASTFALTYYQNDSAYHYLEIALRTDSSLWVIADPDMIGLIEDDRWATIVKQQMLKYEHKHGPLSEADYAAKLLQLIMKDQALDYQIDLARKFYMQEGAFPHWYYPIASMKQQIAADNFNDLEKLLADHGWPKYSTVGQLAADAPLLVINHHENDDVREAYLPTIKEHCITGEGSCMEYAKIQDRILVNSDQLQMYGMQFRYTEDRTLEPFPIEEPEYVDQRRSAIGLEPIAEYLKRKIDYDWSIPQKQE